MNSGQANRYYLCSNILQRITLVGKLVPAESMSQEIKYLRHRKFNHSLHILAYICARHGITFTFPSVNTMSLYGLNVFSVKIKI